jgi:hypothetical protein
MTVYDCPHAEVCKTCPCAAEDDACFPGERLRAERDRYKAALKEILTIENCGDYYHDYCRCLDGDEEYKSGAKRIAREALG